MLHCQQLDSDQVGLGGQSGQHQTGQKELVGVARKVPAGFAVKIKHTEHDDQTNGEIVSYKYHGITSPNHVPWYGNGHIWFLFDILSSLYSCF